MRTRTPVLLTTAALAAALVAPSNAAAVKDFRGKTPQNRTITLRIGDNNLLQTLRINWITRRCAQSGSRFQNITRLRPPLDESTPDAWRDAGAYTVREGRIRSRVRIAMSGTRSFDPANPGAEAWNGTVRATVVVRRGARIIDRCRLRQMTWTATLVT